MFEYTCPTCQTTATADDLQDETLSACVNCGQKVRILLEETSAGEGPTGAAPVARSVFGLVVSVLLIGGCGLVGLTLATGIVSAAAYFGKNPDNRVAAVTLPPPLPRTSNPSGDGPKKEPKKDETKKEPDKKDPDKKDPDKKDPDKKDPDKKDPDKTETVEQKLIKGLASPDKQVQERAALDLAARSPNARKAVPALLKVVRDPGTDEVVRAAGLKALDEIGPPEKESITLLTEALRDPTYPLVRRYAAEALGKLGLDAKVATVDLARANQDKDSDVRVSVATALGAIGPTVREDASPALQVLLLDSNRDVRLAAQAALIRMGKSTLETAVLNDLLLTATVPVECRYYAAWALSACGVEAVPTFARALSADEKDGPVARQAAESLGKLKVRTEAVSAGLRKALGHNDLEVRLCAASSIRDLGLDATMLPAFLTALNSPDAKVRRLAVEGLPPVQTFSKNFPALNLTKNSVDGLKAVLASPEVEGRWFAAHALGSLGSDAASAAPEFRAALQKEPKLSDAKHSPAARLEFLLAITELGPSVLTVLGGDAEKFLDELLAITANANENNQFHQTAATLALGRLAPDKPQGKAAFPMLIKALRVKNPEKPDPIELELHERAKKGLVAAGGAAVVDLEKVLKGEFALVQLPEPQQTAVEKMMARRATFQVLEKIGPPAATVNLKAFILYTLKNKAEHPLVRDAARAADTAIFSK